MSTRRRGATLFVGLALLMAAAAPLPGAVDPFYMSRLQEGEAAYERGNFKDAAQSLRVACFGMLDAEPQLADCLVRLGLAQAGANDREGFAQTVRRLIEGEERVGLYSRNAIPRELAAPFEAKVAEWIPRAALASVPAFLRLAVDPRETQLAALAPRGRRERLQQLIHQEPKEPRWQLLLARLEKQGGNPRAVLTAADAALHLDGRQAEARCLRGWGRAEVGQFEQAAEDLAGCRATDASYTIAELKSRVELGQWGEAESLLGMLPAEQRQLPEVMALAKRVEKGLPHAPSPPPARRPGRAAAPAASVPKDGDGPRSPAAATPPVTASLPPADEALLQRAKSQLARARSAAEMAQAYAVAEQLADRYPHDARVQHTAAEIAYRSSRWQEAVLHFEQGGDPGESQPLLLFYLAVALFESGHPSQAAAVMRRCDGKVRRTPFVEAYRQKILGSPITGS